MLIHINIFQKEFLSSFLHFGSLAIWIQGGDALDVFNIKTEICILRFMNSYVKLHITGRNHTNTQNTFRIQLFLVKFTISISCIGHIFKWQLNCRPVPMRNDDESLKKITWNHIVRMNVEYKAMATCPYTHFQTHIVSGGLKTGDRKAQNDFLPNTVPGIPGVNLILPEKRPVHESNL